MTKQAGETAKDRYHHGDLREALIGAGLELLAEGGSPDGIGLRAVARRVGVSQSAPYAHFSSKRALLAAVAERGFRLFAQNMRRRAAGAHDARETLVGLAQGYVEFAETHPALFRLMFGHEISELEDEPGLREAAENSYVLLQEATESYLAQTGGAPATAPVKALAAWSLVHGLAHLLLERKIDSAELGIADHATLVAAVARLVLDGAPG